MNTYASHDPSLIGAQLQDEFTPRLDFSVIDLLVDGICGVGFPTMGIGLQAEKMGLAYFASGHAMTERTWRWMPEKLREIPFSKLQDLYYNLKVAQNGG